MMKATVSVPCVTGIARRACNRFDAANIVKLPGLLRRTDD
jgi:hypothetical protein